jgi:aminopeptidase N
MEIAVNQHLLPPDFSGQRDLTMSEEKRVPVRREDYTVFPYTVEYLHLTFVLHEEETIVTAHARYRRNPLSQQKKASLLLFGENVQLVKISIDGMEVSAGRYQVDDKSLLLIDPPDDFILTLKTKINPTKNTALEGLYRSSGNYCTQCEAEGFRRITYYPDRPDVLTRFTTRIEADRQSCPVLLSNGNLLESGTLDGNRHFAVWQDPFPKPCYLFALVAGRLVSLDDHFITGSGRQVSLKIFVEERNAGKCQHAMDSLKKAMLWDEQVYGLEYDLDTFMIVAVDDFNMGAMENKGLNIFNAKYVLSSPETATDQDYLGIEGVIAHEYFHNWTGNRVTCRDWFQLSLKEGLTVFRDQEFSSDMNSPAVQRIDDVRILKNFQFKEDAGPMSHPVRPDSYMEINNFYTATVYNKGAEVIRMLQTLLGKVNFRKGMDLYFARHDGQAVTCDDFVAAMGDASGVDLRQFENWYSQAGTPILEVKGEWLQKEGKYRLEILQHLDNKQDAPRQPLHIPLAIGLVGATGKDLLVDEEKGTAILHLREERAQFEFTGIREKPILSFLRDFSAPVKVSQFQKREELAFLMSHDSNLFNRWDASARLAGEVILETAEHFCRNTQPVLDENYANAVFLSLRRTIDDPALLALSLSLPPETTLAQDMGIIDPDALHSARQLVKCQLAENNCDVFLDLYLKNQDQGPYRLTADAMGRRSLKNVCLGYLMAVQPLPEKHLDLCIEQYRRATNMTDCMAALGCLVNIDHALRAEVLADFYSKWQGDPLVLDKWFTLQALSILPQTLENVILLTEHPSFTIENPNKVRALIGAFCQNNHVRFHGKDGGGYRFLADKVIALDTINPQIAARMVAPLINWKRYDPARQHMMREQLKRIAATATLSRDVSEIIDKSR